MDMQQVAQDNRIFEIRVGSHLFGTATPESDVDLFGVFMPDARMLYGFTRCEEVDLGTVAKDATGHNTAAAVDRKLHEYRKYVRLLMENNPNILHTLFVNPANVVYADPTGFAQRIWDRPGLFVHQGAYHRFVAYAHAQLHKMRIKPQNYQELQDGAGVLAEMDGFATMAQVARIPPFRVQGNKTVQVGDLHIEGGVYVRKARKMIADRLATASYRTGMFTRYGFDLKYGSNLIQLLLEGIEILRTGRVTFPLAYRKDILDIKAGRYTAEEVVEWAERLEGEARGALAATALPREPDRAAVEVFVIDQVRAWVRLSESEDRLRQNGFEITDEDDADDPSLMF